MIIDEANKTVVMRTHQLNILTKKKLTFLSSFLTTAINFVGTGVPSDFRVGKIFFCVEICCKAFLFKICFVPEGIVTIFVCPA